MPPSPAPSTSATPANSPWSNSLKTFSTSPTPAPNSSSSPYPKTTPNSADPISPLPNSTSTGNPKSPYATDSPKPSNTSTNSSNRAKHQIFNRLKIGSGNNRMIPIIHRHIHRTYNVSCPRSIARRMAPATSSGSDVIAPGRSQPATIFVRQ